MSPDKKNKLRLDVLLTARGLFTSRERAQAEIMAGVVLVDGKKAEKAGMLVAENCEIEIIGQNCPYVSRGGLKLAGALDEFKIDVTGMEALDIGASTGGFSDCLLQRGAKTVVALDVGKGLLDWKIRSDSRVTVIEGVNARNMPDDIAPGPFDLVVVDVSFISLKLILPKIPRRLKDGGNLLALIKPQFEAGRGKAPGGVVKDENVLKEVLESFVDFEFGMELCGVMKSPIEGKSGNREFLMWWKSDR